MHSSFDKVFGERYIKILSAILLIAIVFLCVSVSLEGTWKTGVMGLSVCLLVGNAIYIIFRFSYFIIKNHLSKIH